MSQPTEEPRTVDRVETGIDQIGSIADIMKPRSRHEGVSSHTRNHCEPLCLSSYRLNMLPPTWQWFRQLGLREFLRNVAGSSHRDSTRADYKHRHSPARRVAASDHSLHVPAVPPECLA